MSDLKMIELCALWEKTDKYGDTYFSGKLNGLTVMVFKNQHKKEDKHPDWRVMLVPEKRDGVTKTATKEPGLLFGGVNYTTDDVPF